VASKKIINMTGMRICLTLLIREGESVALNLEEKSVEMDAGDQKTVEYGDESNPYLNGIGIKTMGNGYATHTHELIIARKDSPLDKKFNENNTFLLKSINSDLIIEARNE